MTKEEFSLFKPTEFVIVQEQRPFPQVYSHFEVLAERQCGSNQLARLSGTVTGSPRATYHWYVWQTYLNQY